MANKTETSILQNNWFRAGAIGVVAILLLLAFTYVFPGGETTENAASKPGVGIAQVSDDARSG